MGFKVLYFTRRGTCKRVAESIADGLSCEVVEIRDNKNWRGPIGFLKGGYYSIKKKDVVISLSSEITDSDDLVMVAPMWAGSIAPAARVFLKTNRNKVSLVVCSSGSVLEKRDVCSRIYDIVGTRKDEAEVVKGIIGDLKALI